MQNPTFGARLRAIRELARVSQGQLASASGINQSTIARLESGDRDNPNLDTMEKLASALGVSLAELLGLQASKMDSEAQKLWNKMDVVGRAKWLVAGWMQLEVDERAEHMRNLGYELSYDNLFFEGDVRRTIERMIESILESKLGQASGVVGGVEGAGVSDEVREFFGAEK